MQKSLPFAEMQPILATYVANLARIAELLLSLQRILTKVESRHDSTNHASMVVLAAPRIVIVYESSFDQRKST